MSTRINKFGTGGRIRPAHLVSGRLISGRLLHNRRNGGTDATFTRTSRTVQAQAATCRTTAAHAIASQSGPALPEAAIAADGPGKSTTNCSTTSSAAVPHTGKDRGCAPRHRIEVSTHENSTLPAVPKVSGSRFAAMGRKVYAANAPGIGAASLIAGGTIAGPPHGPGACSTFVTEQNYTADHFHVAC